MVEDICEKFVLLENEQRYFILSEGVYRIRNDQCIVHAVSVKDDIV